MDRTPVLARRAPAAEPGAPATEPRARATDGADRPRDSATGVRPGAAAARAAQAHWARATGPSLGRRGPPDLRSAPPAPPTHAGEAWGRGTALPDAARARFSTAFGADLSDVELHLDEPEVAAMGARAATSGRHVRFAPGADRPGSPAGDRLLAHELAHVVQQSGGGRAGPQLDTGPLSDPHERQAETAARLAVAGHRVPGLTASAPGQVQRDDGAGQPFVGPVQRTSLAQDYPGLDAALTDEQWDALEAAYDRRLDVVAPVMGPPPPPAAGPAPDAAVHVPLRQVLSDRAQFVDVDVWPTVHGVLTAGGGDELVGELLRNEMMRRFIGRLPVTLDTDVTITLADPLGHLGGPNHLEYAADGTTVGQSDGLIDPLDLDEAFGPALEEIAGAVGQEAYKVALATALLEEVPALADAVRAMRARMNTGPGDVALNEIRGLSTRIQADRRYLTEVQGLSGWAPSGLDGVGDRIDPLAESVAGMLEEMFAYRRSHDPGRALGEMNESAGTWLAGKAESNWDEGGIGGTVVGGLAYAGAFSVAFLDATESVLSMGFHETAIDVSQAWQRGDISRNELDDIVEGAAARAIIVAAVTRGLGAATSRVGVGLAARFGLGELSLARATVAGAVSGGITGPASLATQDLLTRGWAASHAEGSAVRGIIERGIPGPGQYAFATGTGLVLGGLGGRARMARLHRGMEGRVTGTPNGPMRIVRVDPSGTQLLEPIGSRATAAPRTGAGSVVDLRPVVQPDGTVVFEPVGTVDSPVGPMRVLGPGERGTQLVVPANGPVSVPPGGSGLSGVEVVVVPRGWRPAAPAGSGTPRALTGPTAPGVDVPLLPGPTALGPTVSGGGLTFRPATSASLPAPAASGRLVVGNYLRALAAGQAGSSADLVRSHAATLPPRTGGGLFLPPFADPFALNALAPFGSGGTLGTGLPTAPGWTASGYELFPGLTGGTGPGAGTPTLTAPGTGTAPLVVLPEPATPQLMLPAPGQTSSSGVLAALPPVEVVTPDTLVWVNTRSGVYHVQGSSRFRAGTREGVLSTMAEAERAGYRQAGVPLSSGPNVTFEGPAARGEPRYVFTGRVSSTKGARGAQSIVPAAGEYPASAGVSDTHRMHPAARDLGFTPTGGYRLGPDYINTVWDRHIERYIKQLDRGTRASDEIWLTTETFTVPGTMRLQSKTYRVWTQDARTGASRRLFEITFEVDWKRWLANPSSQPAPRVTVDYVSEADIGNLSGFTGTGR